MTSEQKEKDEKKEDKIEGGPFILSFFDEVIL